jgi:hypothetical protein
MASEKKNFTFGGVEARHTSLAPSNFVDPMKNARYAEELVYSSLLSISKSAGQGRRVGAVHH